MKTICKALLLMALASTGCSTAEKQVEGPKLTAAGKSPEVPVELKKLLPKEQLSEKNAHSQAKLLEDTLYREGQRYADVGRE